MRRYRSAHPRRLAASTDIGRRPIGLTSVRGIRALYHGARLTAREAYWAGAIDGPVPERCGRRLVGNLSPGAGPPMTLTHREPPSTRHGDPRWTDPTCAVRGRFSPFSRRVSIVRMSSRPAVALSEPVKVVAMIRPNTILDMRSVGSSTGLRRVTSERVMSCSPESAPPPAAFAWTEVDHRSKVAQLVRWPALPLRAASGSPVAMEGEERSQCKSSHSDPMRTSPSTQGMFAGR